MTPGGYEEHTERVTVAEATARLGISQHAVRQRIRRGTLPSERDPDGRVYVYLSTEPSGGASPGYPELVEELRQRVESLERTVEAERQANEQNRQIIAGLTQRIPQLEAPADTGTEGHDEPAHGPEASGEGRPPNPETGSPQWPAQGQGERSWWRRIFGR